MMGVLINDVNNEVILWTHSNSQSHAGQFSFPQVSTEHSADEADQKDHQLRYKLQKRGNETFSTFSVL